MPPIRVKRARPIGIESFNSWDLDNITWGGWGEVIGTIQYAALIPNEMINKDIKDSKAYKTYLDFATRKATLKKARKFKKVALPLRKLSLVLEEEPVKKPNSDVDDDNDDDNDEVTKDDDDVDSDADEEKHKEEYVHTPDSFEFTDDDDQYEELYKDVNISVLPTDTEVVSMMNVKVHHEEPSTQTLPLLNIHVTLISKTSTAFGSTIPLTISPITPLQQQSTPTPAPTTATIVTSIPALLYFSSLFGFDQRVSALEKEMCNLAQDLKILLRRISEYPLRQDSKNKSYRDAQEHKDLYAALIKSYKLDKDLFESYGKVYSINRDREDKDKNEDPPARSEQGLKKWKTSKDTEPSRGSKSKESNSSSSKGSKSQPKSSGNSTQVEEPVFEAADTEMLLNQGDGLGNTHNQPNVEAASKDDYKIAKVEKPPLTFDEMISTPIDFSAYVMDNLKIENLTQEYLVGPVSIYSKEHARVYKPLPLIEDQGRQVGHANYFVNNDLECLKDQSLSRKYTTSTTKTKAAKYDTIERIEDMVPSLWSPMKIAYDKYAIIIAVSYVKVMKWYDYGYLEEIKVRREDQQLYKFREGDFPRLNLRDIEDMLLLFVQKKLSNLEKDVIYDLNVSLWMFIRRVRYHQHDPIHCIHNPQGIIYLDKFKRNRLMRSDELYKFCDGTLTSVRRVLHDIASSLEMDYLPKRRWSKLDRKRSRIMIKAIDEQLFERRLIRNLEKFLCER
nr:hypothetical protein [Tanacetum cinerariifolium]